MKKTGFNGYVCDFSIDYDTVTVDDILDIHKYLMKKTIYFTGLTILSALMCVNSLSYISMTNKKRKVRLEIINVKSDEPVFYPCSIKTSNCSGSCNNINDPYAKNCVPEVVKNLNV